MTDHLNASALPSTSAANWHFAASSEDLAVAHAAAFLQGRGGKWLLYVDRQNVDEVWLKVAAATIAGSLGPASKVSTTKPSLLARRPGKHVICVYTADAEDEEDVMRVRAALRLLGFVAKISYKANSTTREGKYEGSGRIARYYA